MKETIPFVNSEEIAIDDCSIQITNVERELWKDITKADVIMYYDSIADYILPHIKDRPLLCILSTLHQPLKEYISKTWKEDNHHVLLFSQQNDYIQNPVKKYDRLHGL